jgi:CRP/FNR family nitrogen fixation transcriptional regulator
MTTLVPLGSSSRLGGILLDQTGPPLKSLASLAFFAADSEIYAQSQSCESLYQVEFGAVRICRLLSDGRRQISAFHFAGEVFGFECQGSHHFCAEAICSTGLKVLQFSAAQAAGEVLPMAVQSLVHAQEHLLVLGRQNSVERIAGFLMEMSKRQSGLRHIELPMSRSDIADYLGLTTETVSRVFSRLKVTGVIKLPDLRSVEIVRLQTLRGMVA